MIRSGLFVLVLLLVLRCHPLAAVEFVCTEFAFEVTLSHEEASGIRESWDVIAAAIPRPSIVSAIKKLPSVIRDIDSLSGEQGVHLCGVFGNEHLIVTPRGNSAYLSGLCHVSASGELLRTGWGCLNHEEEPLPEVMHRELDTLFQAITGNLRKKRTEYVKNMRGYLAVKHDVPMPATNLLMVSAGQDGIALLTKGGWLHAENGGGENSRARTLMADAPGAWETWHLETWKDQRVSFYTDDKKTRLGSSRQELWADVPFEHGYVTGSAKFRLEFGEQGSVRLIFDRSGEYVRAF